MSTHKATTRSRTGAPQTSPRTSATRARRSGSTPHAAVNAGRPGTSPTVTLPTPTSAPKFGCAASSHGRVRTTRLQPTARSRHCSRRGGSRSWPPRREQVMAMRWWNGIRRSTTARRPAMNNAHRLAWNRACSARLGRPERHSRGRQHRRARPIPLPASSATSRTARRSKRQRTPALASGTLSQPSGRHRGLGRRDSKRKPRPSAHGCLKGSVTIHGQLCAVSANRSRYPAGTATTRPRGVDIVDLQRVCETWAGFGGIEATRSAGSRRHPPVLELL
jgi:hypothetical protein